MKYCRNCGNPVADGENFCRKCGTKQEDSFGGSFDTNTVASPYYDDVQPIQISKTMQIIIKILLIVAIATVLIDAGKFLIEGLQISQNGGLQAYIDQMILEDPSLAELFAQIDMAQFEKVMETIVIVIAIFALIPLCWILPMSKKILKAMKEGTTLTTGFKVCTLIFVNIILGVVLLCQKDI